MNHKVSELEGALLDSAVAKAAGYEVLAASAGKPRAGLVFQDGGGPLVPLTWRPYSPSTDWNDGGPIIEREQIGCLAYGEHWVAQLRHLTNDAYTGPTALIAAMRAFVASKLGEEVELP